MAGEIFQGYEMITLAIIVLAMLGILFMMFYISRYKKFKTNEYVIHFRNGKVKKAGTGGRVFLLPVFDEIIVIPTTVQQTELQAAEKVVSTEYQDVALSGLIYWRVDDPSLAFAKVSWRKGTSDYVENVIRLATESIVRTTCAHMPIEEIIRDRNQIIKHVTSELHELMHDWGIIIESIEILSVEVLDQGLKKNLEAVKKLEEEQRARLRRAEMEEVTKMRELEVARKTGIQDQQVQNEIQSKAKDREITITQLEQKRIIIAADSARKQKEIESEAQKIQLINQEIDVEAARIKREAEAHRFALENEGLGEKAKMIAQAEGVKAQLLAEAEGNKAKLLAEADGLRENARASQEASEELVMLRLVEKLPEIYEKIKVDKMVMFGDKVENSYGSIAKSVLPMAMIFKEIMAAMKTKGNSSISEMIDDEMAEETAK